MLHTSGIMSSLMSSSIVGKFTSAMMTTTAAAAAPATPTITIKLFARQRQFKFTADLRWNFISLQQLFAGWLSLVSVVVLEVMCCYCYYWHFHLHYHHHSHYHFNFSTLVHKRFIVVGCVEILGENLCLNCALLLLLLGENKLCWRPLKHVSIYPTIFVYICLFMWLCVYVCVFALCTLPFRCLLFHFTCLQQFVAALLVACSIIWKSLFDFIVLSLRSAPRQCLWI